MEASTDLSDYIRVLKLAETPTLEDFTQVSLVAGVGIGLVGALGYITFALMNLIPV